MKTFRCFGQDGDVVVVLENDIFDAGYKCRDWKLKLALDEKRSA